MEYIQSQMQMMLLLSNVVRSLRSSFTRPLQTSKSNAHNRFYKNGLMTHEIEALQSIFNDKDSQHTPKQK